MGRLVLLGFGLLAVVLSTVTEDLRQAGQRLFLPPADLCVGWTPNICAICTVVLCPLMA